MGQKVWVIDDRDWNKIAGRGPAAEPSPAKKETENRSFVQQPQKSPAVAFSLSLSVWGGGQMYVGARGHGSILMATMLSFYSALSTMVVFRESALRFFARFDIPAAAPSIGALFLVAAGLVIWLANSVDAYFRAARSRSEPFLGVESGVSPVFCSLLFPGWGQFLNGQPIKGVFFLLFGMAGVLSATICFVSPYAWPVLKSGSARVVFESSLAVALMLMPIAFLLWIVSAYDAFVSRRELARKRLRSQPVGYRMRRQGGLRNLFPRSTTVLSLLLAISVGMQCIPLKYYLETLEKIRLEALGLGMELIPELVRRVITFLGP